MHGGYVFVGGVVLFTRSLAPYKRKGIRINVLCPEVDSGCSWLHVFSSFLESPV